MIDFLTKHLGLKTRIYSGYLLLGGVAFLIAIVAFISLGKLEEDVREYATFTDETIENVDFTSQMSEIQRQALIYIYEGHDNAGDRVTEIYHGMVQQLNNQVQYHSPEAKKRLAITQQHLENYYQTFQEVRKQRQLQNVLVITTLRANASKAQDHIEQLIETPTIHQQRGSEAKLLFSRMLISFLEIEKNAYRYFDTLNSKRVEEASQSITDTKKLLMRIRVDDHASTQTLQTIESALLQYENSFYEAVQRTRGYLFLVNVVMSAEAYETLYQTKKLSNLITSQAQNTKDNVFQSIEGTISALVAFSLILLAGIGVFSLAISQSIAVPLKRITSAFQALTHGSMQAEIPAYSQDDELGELTKAAISYKEKSIALEKNKKALERSNDELEQFVYTVSHDLKSPIVTSMGFIGIIQKLAKQGKFEQAVEKLDRVVNSNMRMSQLVNDLLELSRVGRTDLDKKTINLNELLSSFLGSQSERMKRSNASITIEDDLPTIYANESRILQVFENLLSNALKYGSGEDGTSINVGIKDNAASHLLYFSDDGQGIPKEYQEKIFGLFYRLDSNVEGTGIGLAVSKKVMTNHGGKIWVESTPGQGATFWLEFPKDTTSVISSESPEEKA